MGKMIYIRTGKIDNIKVLSWQNFSQVRKFYYEGVI